MLIRTADSRPRLPYELWRRGCRLWRAVGAALRAAGLSYQAIDIDAAKCGERCVHGTALAEELLRKAGIDEACGLVAAPSPTPATWPS